ncbi:MAG: sulfotransferase domain-containing protein, partial [Okeania sp. SIO3H1]|nr:sulfotransferase domain-containing protein [Okeania sp. SIO3H1]
MKKIILQEGASCDNFFECFINGEVDWGDYFDHLVGWVQHKSDKNVFLTYESMKKNPKINIIAIAKFLGDRYVEKIERPQILESILHHTNFTSISKNQ